MRRSVDQFLLGCVLPILTVSHSGCRFGPPPAARETPRQQIPLNFTTGSVLEIDVGEIPAETRKQVPITLCNSTGQTLSITEFEITCECLTIEDVPQRVASGATATAKFVLDLSPLPEFTGDLEIGVTGSDATGRRLFQLSVLAHVGRGAEDTETQSSPPMPVPMPEVTERTSAGEASEIAPDQARLRPRQG